MQRSLCVASGCVLRWQAPCCDGRANARWRHAGDVCARAAAAAAAGADAAAARSSRPSNPSPHNLYTDPSQQRRADMEQLRNLFGKGKNGKAAAEEPHKGARPQAQGVCVWVHLQHAARSARSLRQCRSAAAISSPCIHHHHHHHYHTQTSSSSASSPSARTRRPPRRSARSTRPRRRRSAARRPTRRASTARSSTPTASARTRTSGCGWAGMGRG